MATCTLECSNADNHGIGYFAVLQELLKLSNQWIKEGPMAWSARV